MYMFFCIYTYIYICIWYGSIYVQINLYIYTWRQTSRAHLNCREFHLNTHFLQCAAVGCCVPQCAVVRCKRSWFVLAFDQNCVMQHVAVCCSVLQCLLDGKCAMQCVAVCCSVLKCSLYKICVMHCVAACCSLLQCLFHKECAMQCIAVYCSVLQCVAAFVG